MLELIHDVKQTIISQRYLDTRSKQILDNIRPVTHEENFIYKPNIIHKKRLYQTEKKLSLFI